MPEPVLASDVAFPKKIEYIENRSDYSEEFIASLEMDQMNYQALIGNKLILSEGDTVYFPEEPKIGVPTKLTARSKGVAMALSIERINQSTIEYQLEITEFGKDSYFKDGQADLSAHFFFGSGREKDSGPVLLGKIIKNCNGNLMDIQLDNFPTLIEK